MPLAAGAEAEGVQSARVTPGFLLETELQPTDEWLPEILPEPPELAEEPEGWRRIEMQTASSSKLWAYLPRDAILVPSDAATTGVFRI